MTRTDLLQQFIDEVKRRLMPSHGYGESDRAYKLRCPNERCGDAAKFILSRINGSGICLNEALPNIGSYRCYSPWEIAWLLGIDVYALYGLSTGCPPVNLPDTASRQRQERIEEACEKEIASKARRRFDVGRKTDDQTRQETNDPRPKN